MKFELLNETSDLEIEKMSKMATEIVREHFDPIIGKAQNDYMLEKFQTVESIKEQLAHGYKYFFVADGEKTIGFLAFYPKKENSVMYLSKYYLYKSERKKGYSKRMMDFVIDNAKSINMVAIELNVNRNNPARFAYEKLGFHIAREEKNDIGAGFFMDDYVYRLDLNYPI